MESLYEALQHPLIKGAITGLTGAIVVDLNLFLRAKQPGELAGFDWKVALFRYAQGIVGGALGAAGLLAVGV